MLIFLQETQLKKKYKKGDSMKEQDNNQTSDTKNKFKSIRQWMGAEIILMLIIIIWLPFQIYDNW